MSARNSSNMLLNQITITRKIFIYYCDTLLWESIKNADMTELTWGHMYGVIYALELPYDYSEKHQSSLTTKFLCIDKVKKLPEKPCADGRWSDLRFITWLRGWTLFFLLFSVVWVISLRALSFPPKRFFRQSPYQPRAAAFTSLFAWIVFRRAWDFLFQSFQNDLDFCRNGCWIFFSLERLNLELVLPKALKPCFLVKFLGDWQNR